jgi:hypothetical protein
VRRESHPGTFAYRARPWDGFVSVADGADAVVLE